ncbi:very short patch repair endonuclease [Rhizobium sp. AU243]|uniref:very short patch repair endonuclease n=1 Tax=Rhizobium sp. AU243 TaxID=2303425 RepID=UPI0010CB3F2A|nr:very short patch repair endonuclease [Rhizobium sp. AU243]TKV76138.1 DNA mismatch endonuclease Vsr [Rhizobium sp. AU243]
MADTLTPQKRSWNMSRIRGANTGPERRLRSLLHQAGFRFRLHGRDLPGKPDIILPRYRTVVFVHGCFWHRHPGCRNATSPSTRPEFWSGKFAATVARDSRNATELTAAGWRVITVWECELAKNPQNALSHVIEQLKEQR